MLPDGDTTSQSSAISSNRLSFFLFFSNSSFSTVDNPYGKVLIFKIENSPKFMSHCHVDFVYLKLTVQTCYKSINSYDS